ncbi:hypothetical protein GIB67_011999 [Kingdonia uniflora]|uniref:DUF4283 domain-containing protein n=1 Tax=Kingdonia uniflora TaxID=39325 RepID=A0A7J7M093_9MAGN|nr:hypothetical protein GIB67_011999 [Kingdonia uniflora]
MSSQNTSLHTLSMFNGFILLYLLEKKLLVKKQQDDEEADRARRNELVVTFDLVGRKRSLCQSRLLKLLKAMSCGQARVNVTVIEKRLDFGGWQKAVVYDSVNPDLSWQEIGKVIVKHTGKEEITLFPFGKGRSVFFAESVNEAIYFVRGPLNVQEYQILLHPWTPAMNTFCDEVLKTQVVSMLRGMLWGLLEVDHDTSSGHVLSAIRLEVQNSRGNAVPRRVSILDKTSIITAIVELEGLWWSALASKS